MPQVTRAVDRDPVAEWGPLSYMFIIENLIKTEKYREGRNNHLYPHHQEVLLMISDTWCPGRSQFRVLSGPSVEVVLVEGD